MIVLKIGGDIFQKGLKSTLGNDIRKVLEREQLVIVHGGGDEVTKVAGKLGKEQVFITSPSGIRSRYTDKETVEIYAMVMAGRINKAIVKWLLSYLRYLIAATMNDNKLFPFEDILDVVSESALESFLEDVPAYLKDDHGFRAQTGCRPESDKPSVSFQPYIMFMSCTAVPAAPFIKLSSADKTTNRLRRSSISNPTSQ